MSGRLAMPQGLMCRRTALSIISSNSMMKTAGLIMAVMTAGGGMIRCQS